MKKTVLFILVASGCISLTQVQAQSPPVAAPTTPITYPEMPPLPTTVPVPSSTTTSPEASSTRPADPLSPASGPIKTLSTGKYDEYQSICREKDYDRVSYVNKEIKDKRIAFLNEKIEKTLTNSKLKIRLLKEFIDQGRIDEAKDYYTKLKNEKIPEEDEKIAEAMSALIRNEKNKAQALLSSVVIANPKNKDALSYLAEVYLSQKNYFEANAAYTDLQRLTGVSYDEEQCEVTSLHSQHKEAEIFCRKAIKASPKSPFPYVYLGVSNRERLIYDEAIYNFKKSIQIKPTEMAYTCLAEVYYIKEKFDDSIEAFKKAVDFSPMSIRALIGLAWAEFKNKKFDDALKTFVTICKKDPRYKIEIRKAYKNLSESKSAFAKNYADASLNCNE